VPAAVRAADGALRTSSVTFSGRVLEGVLEPVVRRGERRALQRVLDAVLELVEARPAQAGDEALAALGEAS
jgi:hypothetical protein